MGAVKEHVEGRYHKKREKARLATVGRELGLVGRLIAVGGEHLLDAARVVHVHLAAERLDEEALHLRATGPTRGCEDAGPRVGGM